MKISEWWDHNAKYIKAYASYLLAIFALKLTFTVLGVRSLVALPITSFGVSESVAGSTSIVVTGVFLLLVGFVIFRNAVRKFVLHKPE